MARLPAGLQTLRGRKVLAVDPGIRTGCKLAVLDETGKLLEDAVVYPHGQKKNQGEAKRKLEQLARKHRCDAVELPALADRLRDELDGLENSEERLRQLDAELKNRERDYLKLAE